MKNTKYSSRRLLLLEAYRGIAAVLIVFYHFTVLFRENFNFKFLNNFFLFGQCGVDFFFILSSFILAYRYSGTTFASNTVFVFLKKRFSRIYPTYWVIAGMVGIIYVLFFPQVITPVFIFSSITLYPYWPRLIAPAWTLFYELLFYVFFAISLLIKNKKISIFIAILQIFLLLFYNLFEKQIALVTLPVSQNLFDYLTHFIFIEFFIGLGLYRVYVLLSKKSATYIKVGLITSLLCLCVLAINYSTYFKELNDIRRLIFVAFPIASLILFSALLESKVSILIPKWALLLGKSSYSIFITHTFILSVQSKFLSQFTNLNYVMLTTYMIAGISYAIMFGIGYYLLVETFLFNLHSGFRNNSHKLRNKKETV